MMKAGHSQAFSRLADFSRLAADGTVMADPDSVSLEVCNQMVEEASNDGYGRGLADGRAERSAEIAAERATDAAEFERRLTLAREEWTRAFCDRFGEDLSAVHATLARSIAVRLATVVEPWLDERLRHHAMHELEECVLRAVEKGSKPLIEGPQDLIDGIRGILEGRGVVADYTVSPTPSLKVSIDDTVIEERFDSWLAELKALTV